MNSCPIPNRTVNSKEAVRMAEKGASPDEVSRVLVQFLHDLAREDRSIRQRRAYSAKSLSKDRR